MKCVKFALKKQSYKLLKKLPCCAVSAGLVKHPADCLLVVDKEKSVF